MRLLDETTSYVDVVFAENVGLVRARNAEKKLAKKGRLVPGIMCKLRMCRLNCVQGEISSQAIQDACLWLVLICLVPPEIDLSTASRGCEMSLHLDLIAEVEV